ncbi:hypothetical protein EJV47_11120 [Hymenobacter gummosus]|uniref:DUF5723 domain-containing protein n=1 Tax=Hymenobacter gummosus TaxID=1776032 RepID=A0A431U3V2_9BACT|nr:DUF5723 family protein [Hymenobacter gummosus]RTQ50177.1 hypothetical protein EJV47_11120 [Hymenobacter gummosus]
MKRLLTGLALTGLALAPAALHAQNELSNFGSTGRGGVANTFVSDYQAIGINPANLARIGSPKVAVGLLQFGVGVGSQSLTREQMMRFIKRVDDRLTQAEKQELAKAFTSDNALNVNADVTTFGAAVSLLGLGTVAISNQQRFVSHAGLNKNMAEILFLGKNAPIYQNYQPGTAPLVSTALEGTRLQMSWLNEFNVAFGRRILDNDMFQLSAGVGYRYIEGVGVIDIRAEDGKLNAFGSVSPLFDINYGDVVRNPQFNYRSGGSGLRPVGKGNGFDLGVAIETGKALRLGLSLTDVGSMKWTGNLLTANDQRLKQLNSTGVNTYNFFKEAAQLVAAGTDSLFQYQPSAERSESLPTKLRAGAGLRISEYFEVGLDATIPLNNVAGNLPKPFIGAGVDFKPIRWLRLSSGLSSGAGYGFSLPLGVTLATKHYEAGLSTRDLVGLFTSESPYVSVATGFLRFKFGEQK